MSAFRFVRRAGGLSVMVFFYVAHRFYSQQRDPRGDGQIA
jgi:hypothetical protein